jgi:uncharacterized protein
MPADPVVVTMAVLLSLAVGLLMGVIGGGGSFVYLLMLVIVCGVPAHLAVGTGVVLGAATSLAATGRHVRNGTVRWRTAALIAAVAAPTAVAGALLIRSVPEKALLVLVVAATAVLGVLPLLGLRTVKPADEQSVDEQAAPGPRDGGRRPWWRAPVAAVVGLGTGAVGLAGGAPLASYLATVERLAPVTAIGTAMAAVTVTASGAAAGHIAFGQVSWAWAGILSVGAIGGGYVGAALVARLPQRALLATLGVLSLLTSVGLVMGR